MSNKLLQFDDRSYYKDMISNTKKNVTKVRDEMLKSMKTKIGSIKFKDNKVRMAGSYVQEGYVTSDAERKRAVLNSIIATRVDNDAYNSLKFTIYALKDNFKQSHIGLYYEYGTGRYNYERGWEGGIETRNPHRPGMQIVSRSRHIDYAGLGKGKWYDLGGNIRITGSRYSGRYNAEFRQYIGPDIEAHYWFRNTVREYRSKIIEAIKKAIQETDISKYIKCMRTFTLGQD